MNYREPEIGDFVCRQNSNLCRAACSEGSATEFSCIESCKNNPSDCENLCDSYEGYTGSFNTNVCNQACQISVNSPWPTIHPRYDGITQREIDRFKELEKEDRYESIDHACRNACNPEMGNSVDTCINACKINGTFNDSNSCERLCDLDENYCSMACDHSNQKYSICQRIPTQVPTEAPTNTPTNTPTGEPNKTQSPKKARDSKLVIQLEGNIEKMTKSEEETTKRNAILKYVESSQGKIKESDIVDVIIKSGSIVIEFVFADDVDIKTIEESMNNIREDSNFKITIYQDNGVSEITPSEINFVNVEPTATPTAAPNDNDYWFYTILLVIILVIGFGGFFIYNKMNE